jgi:protein tyrosine phosphatase (PTP) superfamily phosphohydrolase (DUF442 family)
MTISASHLLRLGLAALLLSVFTAACTDRSPEADAPGGAPAEAPAGAEAAPPSPAPATDAPRPTAAAALGLESAAEPRPGLVTAAQPRRRQMEELIDLGYVHFISLRPADEDGAGWEELDLRGQEVSFTRIPVAGGEGLTRANVEALDRALESAGDGPTVLYCSSSNRVGALLALRAYWLEGATAAEALELGRGAGLAGLEPAVRELLGNE